MNSYIEQKIYLQLYFTAHSHFFHLDALVWTIEKNIKKQQNYYMNKI